MNTIYQYTTKSQSKRSVAYDGEIFPVRLKVGETMLTANERIQQQDSTSNSEKLDKIFERTVPQHITDHVLHKALQKHTIDFKNIKMQNGDRWTERVDDLAKYGTKL